MKKISFLVLLVGLFSFVSAHVGDDDYSHHAMMGWTGSWGNPLFFIYQILFIVILVLVIAWLIKQIQKKK
ncbi:MAG: hypothetical protein NUV97_02095 [archaeon]|nr:hypothetical protein [archaeon]MCR4323742.1 hypothetical protein [Nanoarchaeota archaeon]